MTKQKKLPFTVGDSVEFTVGNGWVRATVTSIEPGREGTRGKEYPAKVTMKTVDNGKEVTRSVDSVRKYVAPKATKSKTSTAKKVA